LEASIRPDAWLFGESQSRIVVSVKSRHLARLREIAAQRSTPLTVLGTVRGSRLRIGRLVDVDVTELRDTWSGALAKLMRGEEA